MNLYGCIFDCTMLWCCSGNVIGYAVAIPCRPCLDACNNGHYYMFYSHAVEASERLDSSGKSQLYDQSGIITLIWLLCI